MPPATSPKKNTNRRHHPIQPGPGPRSNRPNHPTPHPSSYHQPHNYRDMATTPSSSSYHNLYPGPYVQPGPGPGRSMPAPPPHILPQTFLGPPSASHPNPILPQRHANHALETLRDAALSLTKQDPPPRDPEDRRPVFVTKTRINPDPPPHVEGLLPQYPPGYVPPLVDTYVIAPHQVPSMSLPPLPSAQPTTGSLEQYRTGAPPRPKPKKKRFGELPEEGQSLSDGPLRNLTLKGPSSPSQARATPDWQEVSRRMLHPRSIYSPPSPPRLTLPPLEGGRSRRSSRSAANSRESSKSNSQPDSGSNSQNNGGSQPMVQIQKSALDLDLAPPMLAATSMTTIRTNSTQETILASPTLPPTSRPNLGNRSSSFQLPAPILGANTLKPESLPPLEAAIGMKRRWSSDESASKREKDKEARSSPGKSGSGSYWKTGQ